MKRRRIIQRRGQKPRIEKRLREQVNALIVSGRVKILPMPEEWA